MVVRNDAEPVKNPYTIRIREFPGRIFCLHGCEDEKPKVQSLLADAKRIYLELGSGSGQHLLVLGEQNPGVHCIGLELRYKRAVRTLEKAERSGITNVYVIHADARRVEELFSPRSISRLMVNFPDPWEKKRHAKHRLLSEWLITAAERLLCDNGVIAIKTDHEEQFDRFAALLQDSNRLAIGWASRDLHRSVHAAENIQTEFETLFRNQGLPIYAIEAVKRGTER